MGVCDEGEVNHDAVAGAIALVASGDVPSLPLPPRRVLKLSLAWERHGRGAKETRTDGVGGGREKSTESTERKERKAGKK